MVKSVIEEYAALPYAREELHNIPSSDIALTISDQLFLDVLLMKIRGKTISYATIKKTKTGRKRKETRRQYSIFRQKGYFDS